LPTPPKTQFGLPTAEPEEVGLSRPALTRLGEAMAREIAAGRACCHNDLGRGRTAPFLPLGHGYGFGFAVRVEVGVAPTIGSIGEFSWGGIAETAFWVSPRDALFAIVMTHAPDHYLYFRQVFRNMVNAAIL
jgi:CubicO group peptidase (beta-lactamase class C family)